MPNPCPKPTQEDRKLADVRDKETLSALRHEQRLNAWVRDDGFCVFCWFQLNKKVKAVDVHHVYGRGQRIDSYREKYSYLVCTCREHHPEPIYGGPGAAKPAMQYVENILIKANALPINPAFTHHESDWWDFRWRQNIDTKRVQKGKRRRRQVKWRNSLESRITHL